MILSKYFLFLEKDTSGSEKQVSLRFFTWNEA